tara:strand:+ start:184 stop:888 length:705 start_codon:yes stop_codon:yes gene_type:complete
MAEEEEEEELLDYEEEDVAPKAKAAAKAADGGGKAKGGDSKKKGYVGMHSTGFRDFLLKPELLRAIVDCGFEHPSEGEKSVSVSLSRFSSIRREREREKERKRESIRTRRREETTGWNVARAGGGCDFFFFRRAVNWMDSNFELDDEFGPNAFGNDDKQQTKILTCSFSLFLSLSFFLSLSLVRARVSKTRSSSSRKQCNTNASRKRFLAWTCSAKQSRGWEKPRCLSSRCYNS